MSDQFLQAEAEVFVLPISFAQQRLWFLQQLMPDPAYNVPLAVRLTGNLNFVALKQAFNEIVRRHEALRTQFRIVDGQPMQAIASHLTIPLPLLDLQTRSPSEQQAEIERITVELFQQPFDLTQDALLRVKLLQLSQTEQVLVLTMHHIVADGWSIAVFVRELGTLYTAFAAGQPSPLPELPIQYADFAHWQRQWFQGEVLTKQLAYWKQQLAGAPPVLDLPIAKPSRSAVASFQGARESLLLPQPLREAMVRLSDREGVTLFMTLLAAFQTLLYRYTNQEDIVVGSPIAGRNRSELEGLIGFFVNSLVLRTNLSGNPTFRELLRRVREVTLGAYAHQDLPFEKLVEALQPERDLNRNPLFQIVFALQNAPIEQLALPGITLSLLPIEPGTARFDLEFQLVECLETLAAVVVYRTDLYDQASIARMLGHFQTLLQGIAANPDQRLSDLPLLTAAEQQQLALWNQTQADYPRQRCIHHWFEAQVSQTPAAIAIAFTEPSPDHSDQFLTQQLTYQELNQRSNQLAHHLQQIGVTPDLRIGICLDRSIELLVAVLGVLKAGAAYVPLDPAYPAERLQFMLEDAQVSILLTQQAVVLDDKLQIERLALTVICLDQDWQTISQCSSANPSSPVTADHLAYLIYTSGSTGQPKGVLVPHRGLSNLAQAQIQVFQVQPGDRVLQFASLSFDASIFEIIMALAVGATLQLAKPELLLGTDLLRLLQTQKITHATLPPLVLKLLPAAALPALTTVISAGEACAANLVEQWATDRRFFNAYGLTETSVWATVAELKAGDDVLLGRAIANTQLYVLDPHLQPVPVGIPGELYIGGDGLAQGYLNRPEQTAQHFIPNPFSQTPARLYKTGDWVCYRSDGNLEFRGRVDDQAKIRSYRIELGEIEAALRQHPAVEAAVVVVQQDSFQEKQLVAHIVFSPGQTAGPLELNRFLRRTLPTYMIPAAFITQSSLPLLPNGKVHRNKLADLTSTNTVPASPSSTPRTPTEAALAKLWAEQLDLKQVDVSQNFFDQGGDSLRAVRLMEQIHQQFGRSLPLSTLFLAPTVEQLAVFLEPDQLENSRIANISALDSSSLVPLQPYGVKPPFFCVHPIFGTVFPYYHLAQQLGTDQPFYGLQPLGLDGKHSPHTRIEEMATHYIQAMRQVQPEGPYYISGWSFGGVVAFEIAQQLDRAGHQVALLAILDTLAPVASNRLSWSESARFLVATVARSILPFLLDYGHLVTNPMQQKFKQVLFRGLKSPLLAPLFDRNGQSLTQETRSQLLNELALRPMLQIYHANMQAFLNYVPQAYPNPITLFKTQENLVKATQDLTLGWNELTTAQVKIHPIPGNHFTLLRQPHVQVLSEKLQHCITPL